MLSRSHSPRTRYQTWLSSLPGRPHDTPLAIYVLLLAVIHVQCERHGYHLYPDQFPAQLVNLPTDWIASTWRKYLDSFATCLLHWGNDPNSPSGQRLKRLYWESNVLWGSVQIKHPDRLAVSISS
jgi:hypothetical protein